MKKLLLVLMVVAMASFLFVGCLGTGIISDNEEEEEEEPTPVTIAVDTFVACGKDVIVTLPTAVETDYVVYVAQKVETAGVITYESKVAATPNAARTVWTYEDYEFGDLTEGKCEPICLVALVKHPCCPGEEVALRVVTVDCDPPTLDLFVKFTDCEDVCVEPDPCVPEVPGAYMQWTSRTTGLCATVDCCKDACSGVNGWSLVADPDPCLGPCDTETGIGCPVEGVDFTFEDNVGNTLKSTWKLEFDTGSIIGFELGSRDADGVYQSVPGTPLTADTLGWYTVYNDLTCPLATFK
jgi:hypothetical protein